MIRDFVVFSIFFLPINIYQHCLLKMAAWSNLFCSLVVYVSFVKFSLSGFSHRFA